MIYPEELKKIKVRTTSDNRENRFVYGKRIYDKRGQQITQQILKT